MSWQKRRVASRSLVPFCVVPSRLVLRLVSRFVLRLVLASCRSFVPLRRAVGRGGLAFPSHVVERFLLFHLIVRRASLTFRGVGHVGKSS